MSHKIWIGFSKHIYFVAERWCRIWIISHAYVQYQTRTSASVILWPSFFLSLLRNLHRLPHSAVSHAWDEFAITHHHALLIEAASPLLSWRTSNAPGPVKCLSLKAVACVTQQILGDSFPWKWHGSVAHVLLAEAKLPPPPPGGFSYSSYRPGIMDDVQSH